MEQIMPSQINLCRQKGGDNWPYFFSLYHNHLEANWKAVLSNGEVIYQDDYANGDAWERLQEYCKESNLVLEHFCLEHHDHVLNILPPLADAYFFRRGIISEFICESNGDGINTPFQGKRSKSFIIGYLDKDGLLRSYQVKIPELEVMFGEEIRNKEEQIKTNVLKGKALFVQRKSNEENLRQ